VAVEGKEEQLAGATQAVTGREGDGEDRARRKVWLRVSIEDDSLCRDFGGRAISSCGGKLQWRWCYERRMCY